MGIREQVQQFLRQSQYRDYADEILDSSIVPLSPYNSLLRRSESILRMKCSDVALKFCKLPSEGKASRLRMGIL